MTVRVDRKEQRVELTGDWAPTKSGFWGERVFLLNFQVKMRGFMHFIVKKTLLVARNQGQGAKSTPGGLKM